MRSLAHVTTVALLAFVAGPALARPARRTDDAALSASDHALLARYNPVLVIAPQDPARQRPGRAVLGKAGKQGFGDYHPISVESYAERSQLRPRQGGLKAWKAALTSVTGIGWKPLEPTAIAKTRRVALAQPTDDHELDLGGVRAQGDAGAWGYLGKELAKPEGAALAKPVVYGRIAKDQDGHKILQYYYLYLYNDFINNHEADWEMATIRLDHADRPIEMALSSHHGGTRQDWQAVGKEGERPLAYVARGSHAMYFRYRPEGHPLVDLKELGVTGTVRKVVAWSLRRLRDRVPADPVRDLGAKPGEEGIRLADVEVRALPRWARAYQGTWGGAAKIKPTLDGIGIKGPWATTDARWQDPAKFVRDARPADIDPPTRVQRIRDAIRQRFAPGRDREVRTGGGER